MTFLIMALLILTLLIIAILKTLKNTGNITYNDSTKTLINVIFHISFYLLSQVKSFICIISYKQSLYKFRHNVFSPQMSKSGGLLQAYYLAKHPLQPQISKEYRLLKSCYVPATSTTSSKAFQAFLHRPLTVLLRQTKQAVRTLNQSTSPQMSMTTINQERQQRQKQRRQVDKWANKAGKQPLAEKARCSTQIASSLAQKYLLRIKAISSVTQQVRMLFYSNFLRPILLFAYFTKSLHLEQCLNQGRFQLWLQIFDLDISN